MGHSSRNWRFREWYAKPDEVLGGSRKKNLLSAVKPLNERGASVSGSGSELAAPWSADRHQPCGSDAVDELCGGSVTWLPGGRVLGRARARAEDDVLALECFAGGMFVGFGGARRGLLGWMGCGPGTIGVPSDR